MPPTKRKRMASASFGPLAKGYKKARQVMRRRKTYIKGAIRPKEELNYINLAGAMTTTTVGGQPGAGAFACLNLIAEGDDNFERNGRKASMRKVDVSVDFDGPAVALPVNIRALLVWDNDTNGVLPVVSNLFTALGGSATWFDAPIEINNENRFTILADRKTMLSGGNPLFVVCLNNILSHEHKSS
jgi:hypothetical protein